MSEKTDTKQPEEVDLSALGKTWAPPQALDATPEVSAILTAMPWWAARGLLYIIAVFVLVVLLWARFSTIDVLVEARGTLVPEGYVRPVQAPTDGIVTYVLVREGDTVRQGDPIVQLDDSQASVQLAKVRQELQTNRAQLRELRAAGAAVREVLDKESRIAQLDGLAAAAELALRYTTITAPADGIISALDVHSAGEVVQSGQRVARVAPAGVRLVAEAMVPNEDIALVENGLSVKLKLDAFPFQDYGAIAGTISEVSPDAQVDERLGVSFYKVTIIPERESVPARGKAQPLRPGMALTAEIITERKTILTLFTEPFRKLRGELTGVK